MDKIKHDQGQRLRKENQKSIQRKETGFHSPSGHFAKPNEYQLAIPKPIGAQGTEAKGKVQVLLKRSARKTASYSWH